MRKVLGPAAEPLLPSALSVRAVEEAAGTEDAAPLLRFSEDAVSRTALRAASVGVDCCKACAGSSAQNVGPLVVQLLCYARYWLPTWIMSNGASA